MRLIHRKCGHPLVFDHIKNKWFCFKCNDYPDSGDIILVADRWFERVKAKGKIEE